MTVPNREDSQLAAQAPYDANSVAQELDLSAVDAAITPGVAGVYRLLVNGANPALARVNGAAVFPASGAAAVSGFWLPANTPVAVRLASTDALHAILPTGTAQLLITRVW